MLENIFCSLEKKRNLRPIQINKTAMENLNENVIEFLLHLLTFIDTISIFSTRFYLFFSIILNVAHFICETASTECVMSLSLFCNVHITVNMPSFRM